MQSYYMYGAYNTINLLKFIIYEYIIHAITRDSNNK